MMSQGQWKDVAARLSFEIIRRLLAKKALLIAVSGYGGDEGRRRSEETGFDHHLAKPVDYNALLALLG